MTREGKAHDRRSRGESAGKPVYWSNRLKTGSTRVAPSALPSGGHPLELESRRPDSGPDPRRTYGRWRAATLSLIYVLMAAHIVHWRVSGRTLAPLEFNEVMHTFELGIVTAGFLFMCLAALSTLIFGRFFCSWGCHILALQDLCVWLLRRIGIRPQPIRSRVLLLVPPLTAVYLFVWPQVPRVIRGEPLATLRFATDAQGWASFVTADFWRNLPGPWIIGLTFLVCGFVTVYFLGSRSFCTYACPYGAVFGLMDRFAPGRIRVGEGCAQCGRCTTACTSHVRVHEETARYGMVINPACMKDLDCVRVCPQNALRYGFGRPRVLVKRSLRAVSRFWYSNKIGRFGLPYGFSLPEELAVAVVFVAVLLSFWKLYGVTPFFLALALGGIIGYIFVTALRLWRLPLVKLGAIELKKHGRISPVGRVFVVLFACLLAFVGHSGFIRYHEFLGNRQVLGIGRSVEPVSDGLKTGSTPVAAAEAYRHLSAAQRWGLFQNELTERGIIQALFHLGRFGEAEARVSDLLERHPNNTVLQVRLGECLMQQDRVAAAERQFRAVIAHEGAMGQDSQPDGSGSTRYNASALASAHQWLGNIQARRGNFAAAATDLRETLRLEPSRTAARAALGSVLAELGDFAEAIACLRQATRADPSMSSAHRNLGRILERLGRFEEADEHLRAAARLEQP